MILPPTLGRPDIEAAADESDLDEIFGTERHLFYVACTRNRLLVSGIEPASDFFKDLVI